MSELAAGDVRRRRRARTCSTRRGTARFAAFRRRLRRSGRARRGSPSGRSAGVGAQRCPAFRRGCARSTIRRRGSSCAAAARSSCSTGRRVAVVGARACSPYGTDVALLARSRAGAAGSASWSPGSRAGSTARRTAVRSSPAQTVAVLGCGIDRDYPRAHARACGADRGDGLIVSEYPPGVEPAPWRFPARNRIVAGLADATVVVEARERSGALITADLALEEGREVLAVPGEITSQLSAGTNELLRLGATPVTSTADVLAILGLAQPEPQPRSLPASASAEARSVAAVVADAPTTFDELVRRTGLDPPAVSRGARRAGAVRLPPRGRRRVPGGDAADVGSTLVPTTSYCHLVPCKAAALYRRFVPSERNQGVVQAIVPWAGATRGLLTPSQARYRLRYAPRADILRLGDRSRTQQAPAWLGWYCSSFRRHAHTEIAICDSASCDPASRPGPERHGNPTRRLLRRWYLLEYLPRSQLWLRQ